MKADQIPELLDRAGIELERQFADLPDWYQVGASYDSEAIASVLEETALRLGDNYPYFHPLYAGQMLKPPHPVARAAYALAMRINPNNHARDGGRASSEMEIEAVAAIARMFGWNGDYLGHLTSSGTFANLEALWIAGQSAPGKRIVASQQAHYTHHRISSVLKLDFTSVPTDQRGRMELNALEDSLKTGKVGTIVATLGTTASGAVDPVAEIVELARRYGARVHVDAAYGGYFRLVTDSLDASARRAYSSLDQADSIVIDPHKHGLQPYGCGCVLFKDASVGRFYKHDSPYTYFTSKDLHLGEISLECSRAGASAVALWATLKLLPLSTEGEFAEGLRKSIAAAQKLNARLTSDAKGRFLTLVDGYPQLDIVVWTLSAASNAECSQLARETFAACATRGLHLALVDLPQYWFGPGIDAKDRPGTVTCLRSVLMKPEHESWLDEIWSRLCAAVDR